VTDLRTDYRLEDRYEAAEGSVFLSGIQALARIPIEQLRRDRAVGHNSAAFISGYPGSPLGGYDIEVARALKQVRDLPIVHAPAVNEELGATAVMGSQLASTRPDAKYDGVVGIWYGKAPGLDRATDALRHGVFAGASRGGGALALVGDDPAAKSSTMPSSSDAALVDLHMPILYPGTIAECLELGLHGIAISRATGLWSALKIVTPIADGTGTVRLPAMTVDPIIPTVEIDGKLWVQAPSAQFLGPRMVEVEREFHEVRENLAYRYGVENKLNRITVDPSDAWIGIVATGYTYFEVREALHRLGLPDDDAVRDAGIRLLHLRMPVPFDRGQVRDFARGLQEIFVVEEKNPTLERLIRDALYDASERPAVYGKDNEDGTHLLPSHGLLDADHIAPALRRRLGDKLADRLAPPSPAPRELLPLNVGRAPFFCSGCPHNWGVKVPEGAVVGSGTGCHGMILLMEPERVGDPIGITAMGNEGAQWIGMAPFVNTNHIFQNYGDGTYFHSGQLAIQAAIGAKVNITFKILYNDTVAMTGGQETSHRVAVPELTRILLLNGVKQVLITTEDLDRYKGVDLPKGVDVWDRTRIVEAQERLQVMAGVTVLIHDQECAIELRRGRKRGTRVMPNTRVVINHRVCEGCGDCGDVSNCLSVQPADTPLGRKTQIDQATCNLDLSCLNGDCPAFMTLELDPDAVSTDGVHDPSVMPVPNPPDLARATTAIRLAGIGGTGVVTAAQILGTAATIARLEVDGLDQTGLSQKAGPVISDLTISRAGAQRRSNLIGDQQADVIVAFDQLTAASDGALLAGAAGHTTVVASLAKTPTGRQISSPEIPYPTDDLLESRLSARAADAAFHSLDAGALALALTGTAATANILVLGAAVQLGVVPVPVAALEEAIRLNRVAVDANLAALAWGRRWVHDPLAVERRAGLDVAVGLEVRTGPLHPALAAFVDKLEVDEQLGATLRMLAADLTDYQDKRYARGFLDLVAEARAAERRVDPTSLALTESVARGYHKLLAYKDEYEVARLMIADDGLAPARAVAGTDDPRLTWHLHPPALRERGLQRKLKFGTASVPMFKALAVGKRVRGTRMDPFGKAEVRVVERALPPEYAVAVRTLLAGLTPDNLAEAVDIAALPDKVRGYEDLKLRRAAAYRTELHDRLTAFTSA